MMNREGEKARVRRVNIFCHRLIDARREMVALTDPDLFAGLQKMAGLTALSDDATSSISQLLFPVLSNQSELKLRRKLNRAWPA